MAKALPQHISDQIRDIAKLGTSVEDCLNWVNEHGYGVQQGPVAEVGDTLPPLVAKAQVIDVYKWCIKNNYAIRAQLKDRDPNRIHGHVAGAANRS